MADTVTSVMKIRNMIIKNFGGRANTGRESNPYSPYQIMQVSIPKNKRTALVSNLSRNGWNHTTDTYGDHFTQGNHKIQVCLPDDNWEMLHVNLTGPKKAKNTTIPYYD